MGSASRPHRRSRSSKVSYKDSEEEEDEDFSVTHEPIPTKPSESKDFTRRNLALKKVSRSQDQSHQERAESLQIQKAIEESLSQGEGNENARRVTVNALGISKKVDDSEEDAPNVPSYTIDGAGLQCPSTDSNQETENSIPSEDCPQEQEIQIPLYETVHGDHASTGQGVLCKVDSSSEKSPEAMNTNAKVSKAKKEKEDVEWSSEDDDDDDDDDENVTEDESSDVSEDLKRKRKGPVKSQQKGKKAAEKEQKHLTAPVKRPRSSRAIPEAGTRSTKKSLPSEGIGSKASADCKDETCKSSSIETSKKHVAVFSECKEPGGKAVSLKSCKAAVIHDKKSRALHSNGAIFDNASCETPGILSLSAQSPTGLHRRVIGLSRRFKPPPLHPYLPRMEG